VNRLARGYNTTKTIEEAPSKMLKQQCTGQFNKNLSIPYLQFEQFDIFSTATKTNCYIFNSFPTK
jgi:hypothetical protein